MSSTAHVTLQLSEDVHWAVGLDELDIFDILFFPDLGPRENFVGFECVEVTSNRIVLKLEFEDLVLVTE